MKKILILIIFVCFFKKTKAQEYTPFPTENTWWNYVEWSEGMTSKIIHFYCIKKDTTILDKNYQVINKISWSSTLNLLPSDTNRVSEINNVFLIREYDKKIYFRFHPLNYMINEFPDEYIAFDFNLTLNDTFVNYRNDTSIVDRDTEIDVFIDNNYKTRRSLNLKNIRRGNGYLGSYFEELWIEGIGNFHSEFLTGFSYDMLEFGSTSTNTCEACACLEDIITSNIPIQIPNTLNLSPNPTTDFIRLELQKENNTIQILNTQGQVIFQEKSSEKILNIHTQNFASGIYFVIVSNQNGNISKGKFVKM